MEGGGSIEKKRKDQLTHFDVFIEEDIKLLKILFLFNY